MKKSKKQKNQTQKKWLRTRLIFFVMQNFAPFLKFIIYRMVNVFFENKKKSNFSHIIVNYRYNFHPNLMKFGLDLGEELTNE